jgi:hypothetical protein
MRSLVVGLWVCVVTLASTYGGAYWKSHQNANSSSDNHSEKLEVRKVKAITVPIVSDGSVQGYISGEFSYVVDGANKSRVAIDPESYFMDEAFRRIYANNKLDFHHIEKFDLNELTKEITLHVNQRLGAEYLKETLVKSFTFIPKEEMPR